MRRGDWIRDGVALVVFTAVLLGSYHVAFTRRVPPGYFIGEKHLVGMTESELRMTLTAAFDNDELVRIHTGLQTEQRSLIDLGLSYDIDAMVEELLSPANPLSRVIADTARLQEPVMVSGVMATNDEAYIAATAELAAVLSTEPQNPAPGFDEERGVYVLQSGKSGAMIRTEDIQFQLIDALASGSTIIPIEAEGVAPAVPITAVEQAIAKANQWLESSITVDLLGKEKRVPASLIRAGITFVADTNVSPPTVAVHFDKEAISDNVKAFVADAPKTDRLIDEAALREQLAKAVANGETAITAASYVPKPTTPRAAQATTSTSSSTGNFTTVGGSHDAGGPGRTVAYTVMVENNSGIDANEFAAAVEAVLDDTRSWRASGRLHFVRVASGGFPLYFATPKTVDRLCAPLDTEGFTSCSINGRVVINADRWLTGSPYFTGSLGEYRQYLINHEVGHRIGFRHNPCSGSGQAPVMHQQTLGMGGCAPGPWPLDWELERVN